MTDLIPNSAGSPSGSAAGSLSQPSLPHVSPLGGLRPPPRPIPLYARTQLGPIIKRVMENSGTHQAEIARRMRVRPQSLNQYVKGKRPNPSLDWLLAFLRANDAALCIVFPTNFSYRAVEDAANGNGRGVGLPIDAGSEPPVPVPIPAGKGLEHD